MTRMIELSDHMTGVAVTVPVDDARDAIRKWYSEDGAMLAADEATIDELHEALQAQDYGEARDLAAELAVGFVAYA